MAYAPDDLTDKELEALEKRIAEVFKEVEKDLDKEVKEYFAKFKLRDKEMQALVDAGEMTKSDYQQWRITQIGRGQRFEALRDKVAERYTKANEVANAYVNDLTPSIYSLNRNYEAYQIEKAVGSCDFTMWDESTVRQLLVEQPDLMPYYPPSRALNRGIDLAFGKSQITKHVTSGIIRGLAPGKIANELMANLTEMNRTSAVRAARTGITTAQNAGRMDSYIAAEKMGIQIKRRWVCTKDARTRLDHGLADGQIVVGTKQPFNVGGYKMMFPGDKSLNAPGHEIYNCRCTTRTVEKDGIEAEPRQMRVTNPKWEEAKAEETKLSKQVDKLKEQEQAETDHEKRKQLRSERIAAQKELSAATQKRQGLSKDVVVNEMSYSDWRKWKLGLENSENGTIIGVEARALPNRFKKYIPDKKRRLEIIEEGISLEKPIFTNDTLGDLAKGIKPYKNYYDVVLHGSEYGLEYFGENIDVETLCAIIAQRSDYKKGTPIRLISCYTGAKEDGVARYVSDKLHVDVLAPNKKGIVTKKLSGVTEVYSGSEIGKRDGDFLLFDAK